MLQSLSFSQQISTQSKPSSISSRRLGPGNTGAAILSGENPAIMGQLKKTRPKMVDAFLEASSKIKVGYGLT